MGISIHENLMSDVIGQNGALVPKIGMEIRTSWEFVGLLNENL